MSAVAALIGVLVAVLSLAATSVVAAADAASQLLGRPRAHRLAESGARGAAALDDLVERPARTAAAHALVAGTSFAVVAAVGTWSLERVFAYLPGWVVVAVAIVASVVLMFAVGETLPRSLAHANPETIGLAAAPAAGWILSVAYPVARLLSAAWARGISLVSGEQSPPVPWAESEGERASGESDEGSDEEGADELIEAVEEFEDKIVREVMVPRTDMVGLEDDATVQEAVEVIKQAGYSRLPVYHETLDDITGVVYAKDLLACLHEDACPVSLTGMVREALFVPETKPVAELLREMRRRQHIAIVADEYGGTSGLVTMEDLLEELVGEIFDEYDPQTVLVEDLGAGRYRIDARLPVSDLNELLGTAVESEADTIGGLVSELAGHLPEVSESVLVDGLRLVVEDKEGTRVRHLTVEPAPEESDKKES